MYQTNGLVEVNLKNLLSNYKYLSTLNKGRHTAATIKANAYGLGDYKIIKFLYKKGCRHFFVASYDEAIKIRYKFKNGFLYVLNGIRKKECTNYLNDNKIIPVINSLQKFKEISSIKRKFNVALHIDTGINRLGISVDEIKNFRKNKFINIVLIMSHLASADEKNNKYNNEQSKIFDMICKHNFASIEKSLFNSAGLALKNNFHYDMARPGIALYGGHNNTSLKYKIKPVIKLKAEILQIKRISKGEYIGYNQTYRSKKNITIAIIGIGYADGIPRLLSNKGFAYIKKNKFKIIGRVSMDSTTIDISKNINLFKIGNYVEFINYEYDIEKFANDSKTISNEILTSISNRVKRVYKL